MKKVITASIISLLIIGVALVGFFYLPRFRTTEGNPLKAIPGDAIFVYRVVHTNAALMSMQGFGYWKVVDGLPEMNQVHRGLNFTDSLLAHNETFRSMMEGVAWYVSAHMTGAGKMDLLFLARVSGHDESQIDKLVRETAGEGSQLNSRNYDGVRLREITVSRKQVFTYACTKGIFLASFTPFLVEDALRQLKTGRSAVDSWTEHSLEKGSDSPVLAINFSNAATLLGNYSSPDNAGSLQILRKFSSWMTGDLQCNNRGLTVNGQIEPGDSLSVAGCFSGQHPVPNQMLQILPQRTAYLSWIGADHMNAFSRKFIRVASSPEQTRRRLETIRIWSDKFKIDLLENASSWTGTEMGLLITEPVSSDFSNQCYAIIHCQDSRKVKKDLASLSRAVDRASDLRTMEEKYRGSVIGLIRLTGFAEILFGNMYDKIRNTYFTFIGDYLIFANQASSLRILIDDYSAGRLLIKSPNYTSLVRGFPSNGNYLLYVNPAASRYLAASVLDDTWKHLAEDHKQVFKNCTGLLFQMQATGEGYSTQARVLFGSEGATGEVKLLSSLDADTVVQMAPLLIRDTLAGTSRILFQDADGLLYCFDHSGNNIWKKQLDEPILGSIRKIDLFANGKQQYMFNTATYLMVIDDAGNPVGNYPIRLPAPASNAFTLTDFDRNGQPEIYVACENSRVYAYTASGKPLAGWTFNYGFSRITEAALPVRIAGQEGLLITDAEGNVVVTNRFGEAIVKPIQGCYLASPLTVFTTNDQQLISTDTAGTILTIGPNGIAARSEISVFGKHHGFIYTDADGDGRADYIFSEGNEIFAYNQDFLMLYRKEIDGNITQPLSLLSRTDGTQVICFRSEDAGKIWMMRPDGSMLDGFPVEGCGPYAFGELTAEGNMHLAVAGCKNQVHIYSLK